MSTRISESDVYNLLAATGTTIPYTFYLNTAKHEDGLCIDCPPSDNGESFGLYQVNVSEQARAGVPGSLYDPAVNTAVFAYLSEYNRSKIRDAVGLGPNDPDPRDMGAYLAMAHNCGLGTVLATLANYPTGDPTYLGWNEYKTRNWYEPKSRCGCAGGTGICVYGDDVLYDPVTGGTSAPRRDLGFVVCAALVVAVGISVGLWG